MSLRHAVLGLLSNGPASGYDLMKVFELSLANVWPATQSQLYSELNRMSEAGLVSVTAEGPRGRKEYEITPDGLAELRHWMTEVRPEGARRNDMLLRVFFLNVVAPEQAVAYLREQGEFAAERLRRLTKIKEHDAIGDDAFSVHGRLALEWGLRYNALAQEWAEWAEKELKNQR
jgi:DNA-binding PadR family transcriptional regulator